MRRIGWVIVTLALLIGLLPIGAQAVELDVGGKSALLMDVATGTVLYENNAHEKLAPASVTKVMTMLLIMEAIDGGKIGWEDQVVASEAAAAKGGSQIYLKVGETMSVAEMVKSIAVSSANDCACAMAEHIAGSESAFVDMMNQRAVTTDQVNKDQVVDQLQIFHGNPAGDIIIPIVTAGPQDAIYILILIRNIECCSVWISLFCFSIIGGLVQRNVSVGANGGVTAAHIQTLTAVLLVKTVKGFIDHISTGRYGQMQDGKQQGANQNSNLFHIFLPIIASRAP